MVGKLIAMGRFHTVQLLGLEPSLIIVPFTKEQQAWLWHTDTMWQNALVNFTGQLGEHLPSSKLLNFVCQHAFIFLIDRTIMSPFVNWQPFYPQTSLEKLPRAAPLLNKFPCSKTDPPLPETTMHALTS
jgi:hypothetical protein